MKRDGQEVFRLEGGSNGQHARLPVRIQPKSTCSILLNVKRWLKRSQTKVPFCFISPRFGNDLVWIGDFLDDVIVCRIWRGLDPSQKIVSRFNIPRSKTEVLKRKSVAGSKQCWQILFFYMSPTQNLMAFAGVTNAYGTSPQQHADLHHAVCWLQQEVTRSKAKFQPN